MAAKHLVILGAGGHAHSVADVAMASDPELRITFVGDSTTTDKEIYGFPIVNEIPDDMNAEYFVAVGDNHTRARLLDSLSGRTIASVIANDVHIGHQTTIAEGVFVGHQAYIGPDAVIGRGVIVNTRAIVEHQVLMEEFSQVTPACVIAGHAKLGAYCFIGLAARVIDRVTIIADTKVGAGAVVVKDITEPGTYVGIPAHKVTGTHV